MKGMLRGVAALALATVFATSTANAQGVKFGVGGTGMFSLETGGGSSFGGMFLVGFGGGPDKMLSFRVDGTVLRDNGVTQLIPTVDVVYTFRSSETSMFHPYLLAGGGIVHTRFDGEGDTRPMAKAGAGFDYAMSSVTLFAEPTFNLFFYEGNTSKALQVNVGVKFDK